jgi:hypothetical protein
MSSIDIIGDDKVRYSKGYWLGKVVLEKTIEPFDGKMSYWTMLLFHELWHILPPKIHKVLPL